MSTVKKKKKKKELLSASIKYVFFFFFPQRRADHAKEISVNLDNSYKDCMTFKVLLKPVPMRGKQQVHFRCA